jgi:hypothetical protein
MATDTASAEIDAIIARVSDWRGPALARMRRLILEADPEIVEDVKWRKPTNPAGRCGAAAGSSAPARPTRGRSS